MAGHAVGNVAALAKVFCAALCFAINLFLIGDHGEFTVFKDEFAVNCNTFDILHGGRINKSGNRIMNRNSLGLR